MQLRGYQKEILKVALESVRDRVSTVLCAPTGTGKSVVIRELMRILIGLNHKVLVVTPSRLLVKNIQKYYPGGDLAALKGGFKGAHLIGVYKSISTRLEAILDWANGSPLVVIHDECHHSAADQWQRVVTTTATAGGIQIGFSATPLRLDGKPLSGFSRCKQFYDIPWFIDNGYLAPLNEVSLAAPDVEKLLNDLEAQYQKFQNLHPSYLDNWKRYGFREDGTPRPTLIYGTTVEHCEKIRDIYNAEYPDRFQVVSAQDSKTVIDARMRAFERGTLWGLINVQLLTEGVDCPSVEIVQLCRATSSVALLWQQVGRALRVSGHPSTVLDHAGNLHRLGSVLTPVNWAYMFNRSEPAAKGVYEGSTTCPACGIGEIKGGVCDFCGYINSFKAKRLPKEGDSTMESYQDSILKRVLAIRKIKSFRQREIKLTGLIRRGMSDQDFRLIVSELAVFGMSEDLLESLQSLRE